MAFYFHISPFIFGECRFAFMEMVKYRKRSVNIRHEYKRKRKLQNKPDYLLITEALKMKDEAPFLYV